MKNKIKHICYSGVGARKNGDHTTKQFLNIMNKKSKIPWKNKYSTKRLCSEYMKSLKCKSCKKRKQIFKYWKRSRKKNSGYSPSIRSQKKEELLLKKCMKCQKNSKIICDLNDFIKYSGALKGKCKSKNQN